MAFQELKVMQAAYELLSPLDPNAQQRVMAWLSAALADTDGAPAAVHEPSAPVQPVAGASAETAPGDSVTEVVGEHAAIAPQVETATSIAPAVEPVAAAEPEVAVESVAEPAPGSQRGRSAKATGRRAAKAARSAPTATPAKRAQSRQSDRPSGEQFLADLAAAGSFKALAQKYGKSIGTIGNWANQLREQGIDIPNGRQRKA